MEEKTYTVEFTLTEIEDLTDVLMAISLACVEHISNPDAREMGIIASSMGAKIIDSVKKKED